ncbi:glutathione S-transferase [Bordetella petrii]|uniref:glutathione S-transferase n=1 Tax=Bordetella petrii TaxID=94624 RepID=UPI001E28C6C1|nr:glutathione S-transferase [Bordetella petrii]MCD0502158.1 glutathione S-transferase [Bordetella petrii]
MKIHFSPASPFVRKCLAVAHEVGLAGQIQNLPSAANPVNRDASIIVNNPLGQVPTLLTDDGQALYDSRVICEYLNDLGGGTLFPAAGPARWQALADQALADGILGAALLARYENSLRPEALRWPDWIAGQMGKVTDALAQFERRADSFGDRVDIGTLTLGCALGYLDFRYPDYDWRASQPDCAQWYAVFSERASMRHTAPEAPRA